MVESNRVSAGNAMSVAGAGDVNGDGFSDLLVGYRQTSNGQTNEGMAFVYHGAAGVPDTTADWNAESNQANAGFGAAVASAGDLNGDGFADIVVGAPAWDNLESDAGMARV